MEYLEDLAVILTFTDGIYQKGGGVKAGFMDEDGL